MSQPQKILHVCSQLDGYGQTRQLEVLVAHQLASGSQVRIVALRGRRRAMKSLIHAGAACRVLDRRWQRDPFVLARLTGELRRSDYDLLHVWGQPALGYVRVARRFARQVPTITTLPDGTLVGDQKHPAAPPGIDVPVVSEKESTDLRTAQALPADATVIGVAGPLTRVHQVDEAIWNFELVRTLDENVRLVIFGDGPDRHRLERFSRLTSEPRAIRFMGYRDDFRELLPQVDLLWHAAEPSPAMSLVVLEAMACGVPVIANEGPSCRGVIEDGTNGYLVSDNNRAVVARHTRRLVQDEQHAKQLGESAAKTIAERFSVGAMASAYGEFYAELSKA